MFRKEKEVEGIQLAKEEVTLSFFTDNVILCIESPKLPIAYFADLEQIFQTFIWNQKSHRIVSAILRKKNEVGGTQYQISNYTKKPLELIHSDTGMRTDT